MPESRRLLPTVALIIAGLWASLSSPARPIPRQDPEDDEAAFHRFEMATTVRENCQICHSDELVAGQRLSPKQWKAEVEKMIGWGAPVPPEKVEPLIDYLAKEYPLSRPTPPPTMLSLASLITESEATPIPAGHSESGSKLYAANCANCHGTDGQGAELGPNLVEKPILERSKAFHDVVADGRNRMPGYRAVLSAEQTNDVLAWLRGRKFRATQ